MIAASRNRLLSRVEAPVLDIVAAGQLAVARPPLGFGRDARPADDAVGRLSRGGGNAYDVQELRLEIPSLRIL